MSELETVVDLFGHEGFQAGFVFGIGVLGLLFVLSRRLRTHVVGWAIGFAAVVLGVLVMQFAIEPRLIVGIGWIAAAGLAIDITHKIAPRRLVRGVRVMAWAAMIAAIVSFATDANPSGEDWVSIAFPLLVVIIGASVWSYRSGANAGLLGPILAVTILGIWVTIPETDMFTIVVGACLPLGLATLSPVRGRALALGAFALVAVIVWLTISGGETRPLSIIGGWASFGVLPVVPVLRILGIETSRNLLLFGVHAVYSVLATRVVDIWDSIPISLFAIGVLIALATIVLVNFGVPKFPVESQPVRSA